MEKLKIYLDANIIYGFFLVRVKLLKGKISQFTEPKIIRFFRTSLGKTDLFVSCITKAEIFRRLKTELGLDSEEIYKMWNDFKDWLDIDELTSVFVTQNIVNIVATETFKKRISNIIHIDIAKNENFYFVTGDKEISTKGKKFYDKTLSYIEFRQLLEEK